MNILLEPHKQLLKRLIEFKVDFILIRRTAENFKAEEIGRAVIEEVDSQQCAGYWANSEYNLSSITLFNSTDVSELF